MRDVEADLARLALSVTWSSGLALLALADLPALISISSPNFKGCPDELMGADGEAGFG